MSERMRLLFRLARAAMGAITFASTLTIIWIVGPWLETKYWPVVSKLTILSMAPESESQTRIEAYFTKLRPCDYIGIAWSKREGDDLIRVPIQLLREEGDITNPNRPLGSTKAGPWIVGLPMDQIENNSFVELQHDCHPGWTTITEFYP